MIITRGLGTRVLITQGLGAGVFELVLGDNIDRPPRLLERFGDRGRLTTVNRTLTGSQVVVQNSATPIDAELILDFTLLTAAQAEEIAAILDAGGVVTVRLTPGGSTFTATAVKSEAVFEPLLGSYPDSDREGGALPLRLTPWRATVGLYRL